MRRSALLVSVAVVVTWQVVGAQSPARSPRPRVAAPAARAVLPLRRVVLYKNGVGFFEHLGAVRDNGSVSIDFDSAQLDDALKSLTALDLGNGRITGISYNSEAPLGQRLATLRLPPGDRTTLPELLASLRGARLEARSGDRVVAGRLLSVERRSIGSNSTQTWRDELTLVSDAGDIRTVELTPSVSVRLAERDSAEQVGWYLGVLASTRSVDRRRMTIATAGSGQRDLLVSYVSEVPIWKTSYRIVLSPDGEAPLLQGWAIVDNTTAEDWTNIDLSLVAGAPQSFIQQISQPRYVRRPVVQPPQGVQVAPQTHDPTLVPGSLDEKVTVSGEAPLMVARRTIGGVAGGIVGGLAQAPPPPPPSPARLQDLQSAAAPRELADLFEYRLINKISIPRNQSALVPILNAGVSIDRVSVWNGRSGVRPLHALWLTNTTGLTLDGGSFTVLDEGAFAGEGLVDPLKPDEKRLLSYAIDLGVHIESRQGDERKVITRLTALHGVVVQHREQRTRRVYTIRNSDTSTRRVLIEHPTRTGWTLSNGVMPVETSATAYRFQVPVAAKQTTTLVVEEKQPNQDRIEVSTLTDDQVKVLVQDTGGDERVSHALGAIVAAKASIARLAGALADRQGEIEQSAADEARVRENMRALKDTGGSRELIKQYTTQLTELDRRIDALREERRALDRDFVRAQAELTRLVDELVLSIELAPVD